MMQWHTLSIPEVLKSLDTNEKGLSTIEARKAVILVIIYRIAAGVIFATACFLFFYEIDHSLN